MDWVSKSRLFAISEMGQIMYFNKIESKWILSTKLASALEYSNYMITSEHTVHCIDRSDTCRFSMIKSAAPVLTGISMKVHHVYINDRIDKLSIFGLNESAVEVVRIYKISTRKVLREYRHESFATNSYVYACKFKNMYLTLINAFCLISIDLKSNDLYLVSYAYDYEKEKIIDIDRSANTITITTDSTASNTISIARISTYRTHSHTLAHTHDNITAMHSLSLADSGFAVYVDLGICV